MAVKVFDRTLATNRDTVIRAIDWCLQNEIDIINLSLGTANSAHRSEFEYAVRRIRACGRAIVSPHGINGTLALPGCLPGGIAVGPNTTGKDATHVVRPGTLSGSAALSSATIISSASPYPHGI